MSQAFCKTCGNRLDSEDRFCMYCGTPVPVSNANRGSQSSTPASSSSAAPASTRRREILIPALIATVSVVTFLIVGSTLILSRPTGSSLEPMPDVTMEIPDGWVAPSNQTVKENDVVELVPEEYEEVDVEREYVPVEIWIGDGSESECNVEGDVVRDDSLDAEELAEYDPSQSPNAFLGSVVVTEGGGNGEIIVDGIQSQWGIAKQYYAMSWRSEVGLFSEYPNYQVTSITSVCLPENRSVALLTDASLVPSDPIDAAASGISGPDSTRSAYDPDSIAETNQEVEDLYRENFPAFIELVESIDTGGLFPRETDVDVIPSELSRSHAPASDPFGDELEEPDIVDLSGDEQYYPEEAEEYDSTDDDYGTAVSATGEEPDEVLASDTSPAAPDASGESISYDPASAVDDQPDTAWNVDGSGVGESITLEYDDPITVDEIGIVPGYDKVDPSDGTYRFYQLYVVEKAEVEFSDGSTVELTFDRDPSMQYTEFSEVETDSIEITILETYPPGDSPEGEDYPYTLEKAAISEIEVGGP